MTATHAIRIHEYGGPEVLTWEQIELPEVGPGQALIRHTAIGLNYIDTYHRSGLYPLAELPAVLGCESAGVVEAVGADVEHVAVGDRVAEGTASGAYSERRVLGAEHLVRLPNEIADEQAAAIMLKGLTARMLLRQTHHVEPGDVVLIHAAAGGVGTILCPWAKALGATVIGTAGTDEKAAMAAANGCDHTIVYTRESFAERVAEITEGNGVRVVYDGVGKATFDESLECLGHNGLMASFGNASGAVEPFSILRLLPKGLFLARPSMSSEIIPGEGLREAAAELFGAVASGIVTPTIGTRFPLAEVAEAHRSLESRSTTGSTVLLP
ncbi:MAG TPA: quinone oxidoreductase [Acidobacteriota bacterium]|nr:quinone oxidoreductase [Acidobacteriota bacterium]